MEEIQIKDGIHILSGIIDLTIKGDCGSPYYLWEDANGFVIELDGKTYVVFEDPEDGYRSCGKIDLAKNGEVCTNTFPEQKVLVKYFNGSLLTINIIQETTTRDSRHKIRDGRNLSRIS